MTAAWFPDNTVFCNFAAVDALPLLASILDGRGQWTDVVASEAQASAAYLPALRGLPDWMPEPVEVSGAVAVGIVNGIRKAAFGGTDAEPRRHLGEATTCYLLTRVPEWAEAWWITDDREALNYGKRQRITTRETWELLAEGVASALLSAEQACEMLEQMVTKGRTVTVVSVSQMRQ